MLHNTCNDGAHGLFACCAGPAGTSKCASAGGCLSVSISHRVYPCLFVSIRVYPCLFLCVSIRVYQCLFLSISCLSVSIRVYPCLFFGPCLSVSIVSIFVSIFLSFVSISCLFRVYVSIRVYRVYSCLFFLVFFRYGMDHKNRRRTCLFRDRR